MKISEQFAGDYLKAADVPQPRTLTIQGCELAKLPEGETKPALRFVGEQQMLVLNKTNAFSLAQWFGDDTTGWQGKAIEVYSTTTSFLVAWSLVSEYGRYRSGSSSLSSSLPSSRYSSSPHPLRCRPLHRLRCSSR